MSHKDVQNALNSRFSGMEFGNRNMQRVLDQSKERIIVKRKASIVLALSLLTILLIGIAIAANVGVFDIFARFEGNEYLNRIDQAAQSYENQRVIVPEDGPYPSVEFTVNQAYYDGQSLVVAYTLSEQWIPVRFMKPEDAFAIGNDLVSERYLETPKPYFDYVLSPQDIEHMEVKLATYGKVYVEGWSQQIIDHYVMAGDTQVHAAVLNLTNMPDGTTVGYIDFAYPLPEEIQNQDELSLEFILTRGGLTLYEDETGLYEKSTLHDLISMPIQIRRNARCAETLYGEGAFEDYHATALATVSDIEIKVHLLILTTEDKMQEIEKKFKWLEYDLYAGDEKCSSTGRVRTHGANRISLEMSFELPQNAGDFSLVPHDDLLGQLMEETVLLHKSQ